MEQNTYQDYGANAFDQEKEDKDIPIPLAFGMTAVAAVTGYMYGKTKAEKIAAASVSDLIISPIDSDLAYNESAFDPLISSNEIDSTEISPNYLLHAILVCQGLRHISYVKRDYESLINLGTNNADLPFRSGGFKRFYNYLTNANHLCTPFGAEGAKMYVTTNGILFTENFASVSEADDPDHRFAFKRYRSRNTMNDRLKDTMMFYSMSRGLFSNSVLLNYFKNRYNGTGVSFNNLKNYGQDFRVLLAMSVQERSIIDGIIAEGVTIIHNPVAGEFRLSCNITVDKLAKLFEVFQAPATG